MLSFCSMRSHHARYYCDTEMHGTHGEHPADLGIDLQVMQ